MRHADMRQIKIASKIAHEAKCKRDLAAFREAVAKGERQPKVRK